PRGDGRLRRYRGVCDRAGPRSAAPDPSPRRGANWRRGAPRSRRCRRLTGDRAMRAPQAREEAVLCTVYLTTEAPAVPSRPPAVETSGSVVQWPGLWTLARFCWAG